MQEYLLTAIASLAAVVSYLFHLILKSKDYTNNLARDLGEQKGRLDGIEALSDKVLDTVEKTTLKAYSKKEDGST